MTHRPIPARDPVVRGQESAPPRRSVEVRPTATGCTLSERGAFGVIVWVVEEWHCTDTPGARARRCLVFLAPHAFRRVYDFPPDWRTLSAEELLAVSWRR